MTDSQYKLPRVFGKYYLLELINVGGMAEVYRAKMFGVEGFEKIVAIKKILPEVAVESEFIKMFIDEAKIAVQLSHPNIAQILELGKIEDSYFIAMELVNGKDLKTIRKRLKKVDLLMPVEQTTYIVSQVCDGLDYAHRKTDDKMRAINIVHRDISPQNLIISYEGNVKLIDFGIAKAQSKSTKTQAGMLKGKFSYMSPEQVTGQPIDRRSDIFSLGVVLFEMLTGKRLFLGKNDVETLDKIRKAEVPPASVFNSNVPPELDEIVFKALAKDRDERYQWASEFSDDLKRFLFSREMKFSRQDMMHFMSEFFADELEEETLKLEEFKKLKVPEDVPVEPHRQFTTDGTSEISLVKTRTGGFRTFTLVLALLVVIAAAIGGGYYMTQRKATSATLLIDSSAPSTLVNLDEGSIYHKRCETPCKIENILPGSHELELKKRGYIPKKETIILRKGETLSKVVKMFKVGELKTIITVKSDPDGAKIFINDKDSGEVTPAVLSVPVGVDIVLRTEKENYLPVEQNIGKIGANVNREVSFVMKSKNKEQRKSYKTTKKNKRTKRRVSGNYGYVSINSRPWSNVYIDGKFIQATPIIKHPIAPGNHKVHFKNKKFNIDKIFPVTVSPKDHKRIIKNF